MLPCVHEAKVDERVRYEILWRVARLQKIYH